MARYALSFQVLEDKTEQTDGEVCVDFFFGVHWQLFLLSSAQGIHGKSQVHYSAVWDTLYETEALADVFAISIRIACWQELLPRGKLPSVCFI